MAVSNAFSPKMPAAFFGHGSPMNTLEHNMYTEAWRAFGASVPTPRAILIVSAHWYIGATAVTAMSQPKTIHDFYGFPQQLFDVQYAAPGSPELADEVASLVQPTWVGKDIDSWGLDHGTWSVLHHMFPEANVPVVQLSIDATKDFDYHLQLGAKLSALRERGVLILGSGNVVHNLSAIQWNAPNSGTEWAEDFDTAVHDIMVSNPSALPSAVTHRAFRNSVPTPDHFIPLLYIAGLATSANAVTQPTLKSCVLGSLSMTSYILQ
jgi:4,5-DOPA dioxygenase extradiol